MNSRFLPVLVLTLAVALRASGAESAPAAPPPASTEPTVQLPPYTVTGEPAADPSSLAAKTGVPQRLSAQSAQVVPRAVLDDQNALTLADATRNVSGVATDFGFNGSSQPLLILRGFQSTSMTAMGMMSGMSSYYLNGSKVQGVPINMANVQNVEVIKGPDSVLFGRGEPGGLVNIVSRPVSDTPKLSLESTVASFGTYRAIAEASGPLVADKSLLGRFEVSNTNTGSNRDFVVERLGGVSGGLVWLPNAKTRVSLTLDYLDQKYRNDFGVPALGNRPANLPDSRQFNDSPDLSSVKNFTSRLELQRELNADWKLSARLLTVVADVHEVDIWPYRIDLTTGQDRMFDCVYLGNTGRKPFKLYTVAATKEPVEVSGGMTVVPNHTFADAPVPDVIVVPALDTAQLTPAALDWLRAAQQKTQLTMSVCNGSLVLGRAGLLDGKSATAHHSGYILLRAEFPKVKVIRGVRYVEDGKIATAGGLTSGTDLALRVVERYFGREVTKQTAFLLEYQGTGWMHPESNAAFAQRPAVTADHPVCPVCGMPVNPATAPSWDYHGKTYYFCSDDDKKTFMGHPERFLETP